MRILSLLLSTRLYLPWFFLSQGQTLSGHFRRARVFITGYPRSGNTFLTKLLCQFWPWGSVRSHLHNIYPLKYALKKDIPVIVVLRDPVECYSSSVLKLGDNWVRKSLQYWRLWHWYSYVLQNKEIVKVDFEDLVSSPELIIEMLLSKHQIKIPSDIVLAASNVASYTILNDARSPYENGAPNRKKEIAKTKIKSAVDLTDLQNYWNEKREEYRCIVSL